MRPELVVALVVAAFDGRSLDGAVHPLSLFIDPRMVWLGEPVLDIVCLADHVEAHHRQSSAERQSHQQECLAKLKLINIH